MKKLVPTIVALLVMFAAVRLGIWQLERAEYKQDLLVAWKQAPTLALNRVDAQTPRFTRVKGPGRFDPERHILLDNQTLDGTPGVHVFTPFKRASDGRVFLVNRGWLPFSDQRRALPDEIPTPARRMDIQGQLNEPPGVGLRLGRAGALDPERWPNLMTYFDIERIRDTLGADVDTRIIQLDVSHPSGFAGRDWPVINLGPQRHQAYAFQWFSIALAVFVIWLVLFLRHLGKR